MENQIAQLLLLATVVEGLTEYLVGDVMPLEKFVRYFSAGFGILVALLFQADLFALVGLVAISPIASQVLTGIIISRGSNLINDLLGIVYKVKKG